MEDEQILANAPEGATHVDAAENYYVNDVCDWELIEAVKGNAFIYQDASISDFESMRSLSDIRELVELRKEIELSRLQLAESYKRESYQSEETEVSNNLCACCDWLQKEGKYEVKL